METIIYDGALTGKFFLKKRISFGCICSFPLQNTTYEFLTYTTNIVVVTNITMLWELAGTAAITRT